MELALTLATLRKDGLGETRDGSMWLPSGREHGAGSRARRDALRSRAALQLALARAALDDCAALCDEIDLTLRRRDDLRAGRS